MRHLHSVSFVVVLLGAALGSGCTNKIDASIEIDGEAYKPSECHSLTPMGVAGVELGVENGTRIRLVKNVDGSANALLFVGDADKGIDLGDCVDLTVSKQNSTVNKVANVEGSAKIDCEKKKHSIKGKVTFGNCH